MALRYYLAFEGLAGPVRQDGLAGAFQVDGYRLSGGRTGAHADFAPVEVILSDDAGLAEFLRLLATNQTTSRASLVGIDADQRELHRINLGDVVVTSVDEVVGGYAVSLDAARVGVITQGPAADGAPPPAESFGFDEVRNQVREPPGDADPPPPAGPTPEAVRFYMLVPGADGGSTDPGFEHWFALDSFSFGARETPQDAGLLDMRALDISLAGPAGMQTLARAATSGVGLQGVRIAGVTEDGRAVYELELGTVSVRSLLGQGGGGAGVGFSLSLDFEQIRLETLRDEPRQPPQSDEFRWHVSKGEPTFDNLDIDPAADGALARPEDFYLILQGFSGPVTAPGYAGAFRVESFTFGAHDLPGSGPPKIDDVTIKIDGPAGFAAFVEAILSERVISSASLVGVADAQLAGRAADLFRLNLGDALITRVEQAADGGFLVSLDFRSIGFGGRSIADDGAVSDLRSFVYDNAQPDAPPDAPPPDAVAGPAARPVEVERFFLLIDGVDGGSTVAGREGWFELPSFGLGLETSFTTEPGGSTPEGLVGPLSLILPALNGFPELLERFATGRAVEGMRIEGVNASGVSTYRLDLSDVLVTRVDAASEDSYAIEVTFPRFRLQTFAEQRDGLFALDSSVAWDLIADEADPRAPAEISPGDEGALTAGARFYLEVSGLSGPSRASGFEGAFNVESYAFGGVAEVSLVEGELRSDVEGFSPITVVLADDAGLAQFLARVASGETGAASLIGARPDGAEVFRINLSDVLVNSVEETEAGGYAVSLSPRGIGVIARTQEPTGGIGAPQTFSFDAAQQSTTGPVPPDAEPGPPAPPPASGRYYLLVDEADGGSRDAGFEGWFEVSGFEFDLTSSTGGPAGVRPTLEFDALRVTVAGESGLVQLLNLFPPPPPDPEAEGEPEPRIAGIRIEGVSPDGRRTYRLDLAEVEIRAIEDDIGDGYRVTFSYERVALTNYGLGVGQSVPTGTFTWRLENASPQIGEMPEIQPAFSNAAPEAGAGAFSTPEDTPLAGQLAGSDPDGDALEFVKVADPAHGTVTIGPDGAFVYTPNGDYSGPDSFTFRVWDGRAASETVRVDLAVTPVNDAPAAADDSAAATEKQPVTIDVLANDADPDTGDTLALLSVEPVADGAVEIVGDRLVFTPGDAFDLLGPGQSRTVSFAYTIRDGAGETATATVQVTVAGAPDGPARTGGAGNDSLAGGALDERLDGAGGHDTLDAGAGADTLVGGLGGDLLAGRAGIDSVSAGDGGDTILGGAGNDVLAGGRGVDRFVFEGAFGDDTVIDFRPGEDEILFAGAGFTSFEDVLARAVQSGANVVIATPDGDSVQLNRVMLSSLQSGDFLFA